MPDLLEDPIVTESSFVLGGHATQPQKAFLGALKSALLQNHDLTEFSIRKKRPPFQGVITTNSINETPNTAGRPILFQHGNAGVVLQAGTHMYDVRGGTVTQLPTATFTAATMYQLVEGNNKVYRLQGANGNIYSWDKNVANAFTDAGSGNTNFPRAQCALFASQNRMLAANGPLGTSADFDSLYYSNSNDPDTWDRTVQLFRVGIGDGDGIYGLIEIAQNVVLIGKGESFWEMDISNPNPSFWNARKIIKGFGISSAQHLCKYGTDVAMLCGDGIYTLSSLRSGNPVPLTREVQDDFDAMVNRKSYSQNPAFSAAGHKNCAIAFDGTYLWMITTRTTTKYALVLHVASGRWQRVTIDSSSSFDGRIYGISATGYSSVGTPRDVLTMIFVGSTNYGDILVSPSYVTSGTGSGTAYGVFKDLDSLGNGYVIVSQEETGGLVFSAPSNNKNGEMLEVLWLGHTNGGSLLVEYQLDESGSWTTLTTITLTGTAGVLNRSAMSLNGLAAFKTIRFRFTEQSNYLFQTLSWSAFARVNNLELS